MAEAPSPAATKPELPTIIIDPSIYEPEHPERPQSLYTNFIRLTRLTLAMTAVGGATIGFAHMLDVDSLLPATQVAALTDVLSRVTAKPARLAPSTAGAASTAPHVIVEQRALPGPSEELSVAEPPTGAPEVAETTPVFAVNPPPPAAAAETASKLGQARPSVPILSQRSGAKEPSVQGELRNARRLLALNQLEAAEAAYRRVLTVHREEQAALTGLARVQLALGRLELALASAKRAAEIAPEAASARLALADVLRARGDKKSAQESYDLAARLTTASAAAQH